MPKVSRRELHKIELLRTLCLKIRNKPLQGEFTEVLLELINDNFVRWLPKAQGNPERAGAYVLEVPNNIWPSLALRISHPLKRCQILLLLERLLFIAPPRIDEDDMYLAAWPNPGDWRFGHCELNSDEKTWKQFFAEQALMNYLEVGEFIDRNGWLDLNVNGERLEVRICNDGTEPRYFGHPRGALPDILVFAEVDRISEQVTLLGWIRLEDGIMTRRSMEELRTIVSSARVSMTVVN